MIVNIDNITGNEKAVAGKENVKVTYIYIRLIFDYYVFIINFKVIYIKIFFHIHFLLEVNVTYIEDDLY